MAIFDSLETGSAYWLGGSVNKKLAEFPFTRWPSDYCHGVHMSDDRTKLTTVEKDGRWTVRLDWPNGRTRYFGSYRSRTEALTWIALNRWMTKAKIEERDVVRQRARSASN